MGDKSWAIATTLCANFAKTRKDLFVNDGPDLRRLACALRGALSGSWFRACEPRGVEFPCIFRAGCQAAGLRRLWRAQMAARTPQLLCVVRAANLMDCCRFFARRTQLQMADELTLATAPTSKRFPTTNQAKACYMCAACTAPDGSAPRRSHSRDARNRLSPEPSAALMMAHAHSRRRRVSRVPGTTTRGTSANTTTARRSRSAPS